MKRGGRPLSDAWAKRRLLTATMAGQSDAGIASLVEFLSPKDAPPSQNAKPRTPKRQ